MLTEYPTNWKELRLEILKRDRRKCVICSSAKRLEVHHTREKSIPENLITLCYWCHKRFANNYSGFKKKIREFNEIRLNIKNSKEDIKRAHLNLINEINQKIKLTNNLKIKLEKQRNKTLDNF